MLLLRIILLFLTMTGVAALSPEIKTAVNDKFSQEDYNLDLHHLDANAAFVKIQSVTYLSGQPEILRTTTKVPTFLFPSTVVGSAAKPGTSTFRYLKECKTIALRLARFSIAFPFHDFP